MTTDDAGWSRRRTGEVADMLIALRAAGPDDPEHGRIRDELVTIHLPLVRYLARRFARADDIDDLVQVGVIGLLKAIDRFDLSLGHEFASYAAPTVIGEIKRHLRDSGWLVRVPRRAQELHASVARAREELSQELGRYPTVSEIAERVGAGADEVVETLDVARSRTATQLDVVIANADSTFEDLAADDDPGYERTELRAVLARGMDTLSDTERQVVALRFAEGRSQREIAERIGVSQMQVSRLLARSLARMAEILGPES